MKKLDVVGMMAISDFEMAPVMVADLCQYCTKVILRFDANSGNKKIFKECCAAVPDSIPLLGIRGRERWNRWNWREQLIRAADPIKPDYVLFLDSDEQYDPENFRRDFENFVAVDRDLMMFDYEMVTDDGRRVQKYPRARHCKAFKWMPGIGYRPYKGFARPVIPKRTFEAYKAESRIYHYCFYTKEMEQWKLKHLHK